MEYEINSIKGENTCASDVQSRRTIKISICDDDDVRVLLFDVVYTSNLGDIPRVVPKSAFVIYSGRS